MKTVTIFRSLLMALVLVNSSAAMATTELLDQVAAIVDDDIVMESELESRITQIKYSLKEQGRPMPPASEIRHHVLNQMIVENLQMQLARRAGVRINDAQLNQAVSRVAAQNGLSLDQFRAKLAQQGLSYTTAREQIRKEMIIQQVQSGHINSLVSVTDQEVTSFLQSTEGKLMSAPQYHLSHILLPMNSLSGQAGEVEQRALLAQAKLDIEAGNSLLDWLSQYQKSGGIPLQGGDLGWRKAGDLPAIFTEIVPTMEPGEVAGPIRSAGGLHLVQLIDRRGGPQVIDQTHARHILVKPSEIRSDEQCQQLLTKLRQRALADDDFADLARQYSEDFASAQEGGDLGWSRKGQFVPAFEKTMEGLAIDEISTPFQSQFGWHIMQVLERREHDISQETAREQAYRFLFQRKYQEELDAWLQKIRDEAYVDIKSGTPSR
jgi:peptidyl-prolyl cis-trans isomerase SurA